ncbi:MAG: tRNA 2-thiouridine(34) synthase MnmA [Deltaproteobacteria bacterium]|nr:tRNA 2-thiouridine(34) synthase MnmA [Deltaproteobacteria bacterium]
MARVVVGMSGGVDSSATAALLVDQGHEVIGVTLHLWDYERAGHAGRCCAPEDQYDARRVCEELGIAHYTFDRSELFREAVVDKFIEDYGAGLTPSPCVRCNEHVKLGPLWTIAQRLGATQVATGHYARISQDDSGIVLRQSVDLDKDQSYFLFVAPTEALSRLILPLGDRHKPDVRAYAKGRGLSRADKPDSTDLCFVEGRDYGDWLLDHGVKSVAGAIETTDGRVLAKHDGVHRYTVGQRKGIPGVDGVIRYVLNVVPERGAVVVGTHEEALRHEVILEEVRWLMVRPPSELHAKLRYRHEGVAAHVETLSDTSVRLHLGAGQRGVARGQAAVLYDGDRVAGGGFIV